MKPWWVCNHGKFFFEKILTHLLRRTSHTCEDSRMTTNEPIDSAADLLTELQLITEDTHLGTVSNRVGGVGSRFAFMIFTTPDGRQFKVTAEEL